MRPAICRRCAEIGFVFEQFHLFPQMTVPDNIAAVSIVFAGQRITGTKLKRVRGLEDRVAADPV